MADEKNAISGWKPGGCERPVSGPWSRDFPNVLVLTHENRRALFYDDLLRGKLVLVNFMSISDEPVYRTTGHIAGVQPYLGERLGREVFIYSLTVDPRRDTPAALAKFAAAHGAKPGWLFLSGAPETMEALHGRFFVSGPAAPPHAHMHGAGDTDCSMAMIRCGNEVTGRWLTVPARIAPQDIAMRIGWLEVRERPAGPPRRKGPMPPDSAEQLKG